MPTGSVLLILATLACCGVAVLYRENRRLAQEVESAPNNGRWGEYVPSAN